MAELKCEIVKPDGQWHLLTPGTVVACASSFGAMRIQNVFSWSIRVKLTEIRGVMELRFDHNKPKKYRGTGGPSITPGPLGIFEETGRG